MPQDFLLKLVQQRLDGFCEEKRSQLAEISPDLVPIIDYTQAMLAGGKRFRALFCFWSWAGYQGAEINEHDLSLDSPIVGVAAALEMFHAAALVHDDLLDQSDTRRGQPAIHKRFEALHLQHGYSGSAIRFGVAGSVLTGDLLLAWSSELFGSALRTRPIVAGSFLRCGLRLWLGSIWMCWKKMLHLPATHQRRSQLLTA